MCLEYFLKMSTRDVFINSVLRLKKTWNYFIIQFARNNYT